LSQSDHTGQHPAGLHHFLKKSLYFLIQQKYPSTH
jgi:hypothetical protein